MINLREQIIEILEKSPSYDVISSKVEPFSEDEVISVQYVSIDRTPEGITNFTTEVKVLVTVAVAKTEGYDSLLDVIVEYVLTSILTDAEFISQLQNMPTIRTEYGYKEGGDTNLALAGITFECLYDETFEPNITTLLNKIHVGIDFISPASDQNLFTTNPEDYLKHPDGRIEYEYDVNLNI